MKMIRRKYYALHDVFRSDSPSYQFLWTEPSSLIDELSYDFSWLSISAVSEANLLGNGGKNYLLFNIFEVIHVTSPVEVWKIDMKEVVQKIHSLVMARFQEDFCFSLPEDATDEEVEEERKRFLIQFLNVHKHAYDKYANILKIYQDNISKLMDRLGSATESIVRFNDTPQDEGDFADDEHTTNVTKSEVSTETDTATIMGRINEIQTSYRAIENEWLNEFRSLFILRENIL